MLKKILLSLTLVTLSLSLIPTSLMAQNTAPSQRGQQKKHSTFLISGQLPHHTKLLIKQWDNPALNLSEEQKTKLLVIRQETIAGVRTLSPQIATLEQQVVQGIASDQTPEDLRQTVEHIAKMKTEATMIQLKCIHQTMKILTKQQLELLIQN